MSGMERNLVVFGASLLLFCAAIAPGSSHAETRTMDKDDRIQVTLCIHGSESETDHVVDATQQQISEIQAAFDQLKDRLSTVESLEGTHRAFNDTIDALAQLDLLPQGMDTQHLKRLVTRASRYQNIAVPNQQMNLQPHGTCTEGEIRDCFCAMAGNTSNTHVAKLAKRIAHRLFIIMDHHTENALLVKVATALWLVFHQISKVTQRIVTQNGLHAGVSMYFGNYHYYPYPFWLHPAEGWIATNGIRGRQNITGSFWGQTLAGGWQPQDDWYMNYTWRGCLGFTGLLIYVGVDNAYFLGSVLQVHVGTDRP